MCKGQNRVAFSEVGVCTEQKTAQEKVCAEALYLKPDHFSSLIAETKLEKPEQELPVQPGSPKQPLQASDPAPQQECQPEEQEPRKKDEGRERRPSQEKRRDVERHQELPSQREGEEATPQEGGGSRSEWRRAQFGIHPDCCLSTPICRKGSISLRPLEAVVLI